MSSSQAEQVRKAAKTKQIKSLSAFLKIRKRDWKEQGPQLKARITMMLSCCQGAIEVQVKSILSLDLDGKAFKDVSRRTLALLLEAAESCVVSPCRKFKTCEELFSTLLSGISQITVSRGGQLLRVLFIPLKPLVQSTCARADMPGNNQGLMFEAVKRLSCEIIEFAWSKDRALVDAFIMGLAACIRERNDYEEQDGKEKQDVPVMQLNLIRLLADLSGSISKWEVVDMILPLFIESLEEGDASVPSILRLRLLEAVSYMACLDFEKSYHETIVLMTRSYLDKVKMVGAAESKTLPCEATTERLETLPAGFLLVASRITSSKLRSDYRYRLLSLCSDVGVAAESKSGRSGADFLGPLLPALAEIFSDFDPASNAEPSLLKLFRNLWFYIVLFGLAPPIQPNGVPAKSNSTSLNSLGSISAIALQAVSGPYMWNSQWSVAVQHIALSTPPLVVPNTRSRHQMGETTDGGLYEIFQQDYGPVGSPAFEAARQMFMISSAGYAVASLLLQPKDRHNGNLLFDDLCVKGYLAARRHMHGIITTVLLMVDGGLPCFSRGDPIGNLRKRFHPEMNDREAANFMIRTCMDAYNKWTTAGYDLIQYLQQGIEK